MYSGNGSLYNVILNSSLQICSGCTIFTVYYNSIMKETIKTSKNRKRAQSDEPLEKQIPISCKS
jgi:hypothetical protein